jgi:hypothetical protein
MPMPIRSAISDCVAGIRHPNSAVISDAAITSSVVKITMEEDVSVAVSRRI